MTSDTPRTDALVWIGSKNPFKDALQWARFLEIESKGWANRGNVWKEKCRQLEQELNESNAELMKVRNELRSLKFLVAGVQNLNTTPPTR